MAGDYTRFTFNPLDDYAAVLMQQGRVQLDADFNEWVELVDRRFRSGSVDTLGRAVVPRETPDGFLISLAGSNLKFGPGRIYVDGIQAENHGADPSQYDRVLEELRGTAYTYDTQPYWPAPEALPEGNGPHLIYLDVWRREVTHLQDPDLVEKAVGVDTTTRRQTVWQVKVLPDVGPDVNCRTPDEDIPGWPEIILPSAGRLTTGATGVPSDDDPCILPPNVGYRGTENRLYRVEIHNGGSQGSATFKWSRDNASIATRVTTIDGSRTRLGVVRTGKDSVLRFQAGDWVEVTDDFRELAGLPGFMHEVQLVDETSLSLTLTTALPPGEFPTSGVNGDTQPGRHTRIRRWDQKGEIRDSNGNLLGDVEVSGGTIPIPAAASPEVTIVLEEGIEITFSTDPSGGEFKGGDYWVFAARTVDASVEQLEAALPRGIHHHYARLALVTFPENVNDCRILWPPAVEHGCECTVCVSEESHNDGTLTIQRAIDVVLATGGKVCLGPGNFELGDRPLRINGARGVAIQGHGAATVLAYSGSTPALVVENSLDVEVAKLSLLTLVQSSDKDVSVSSILLRNSLNLLLRDCIVVDFSSLLGISDRSGEGGAVELTGILGRARIRGNILLAGSGIRTALRRSTLVNTIAANLGPTSYLLALGLKIEDNLLWCRRIGIGFGLGSILFSGNRIADNAVYGCTQVGIAAAGLVGVGRDSVSFLGSHLNISQNTVCADGTGILVGADDTRVQNNDITALSAETDSKASTHAIALSQGLDPEGIDRCLILGNRISKVSGAGISIGTEVNSVLIKQNLIERTGGGGIVMQDGSSARAISIANNHLLDIARLGGPDRAVGIRLFRATQAEVSGNTISGVGQEAVESQNRDGIRVVLSSSVRISGNEVLDIGPDEFVGVCNGIRVTDSVDRLDISDNRIRRNQERASGPGDSIWRAVSVGQIFLVADLFTLFTLATVSTDAAGASSFGLNLMRDRANVLRVTFDNLAALLIDDILIFLPQDRELVSIRGNLMEAFTRSPLVFCNTPGTLLFSENRCLLTSPQNSGQAAVSLTADAAIVSANYVQGLLETGNGIRLQVDAERQGFTVLGNLTSGGIMLNGSPLPAPWAPLNALLP